MPDQEHDAPQTAAEDVKAKMRQALDRKNKAEADHLTAEGARTDGNERMHGVTGHVDTQNYRRKAGGGGV